MLKESKIRVLENFYALDYIFFGKPVNEMTMCCPLVKEEYVSVKGALMSVYVEMLRFIGHNPEALTERLDGNGVQRNARIAAKVSRENAQRIVTSEKARQNIKSMLKESLKGDPSANVTSLVETSIRNKAFGLAVDNLLIARTISESENFGRLNEWEGSIIEDSYKILRDSLVECAYAILYSETDEPVQESEEVVTEAPIVYSGSKIRAMAEKHGRTVEMKEKAGCEKWSVKTPFKDQGYKDKMLACKAKATIKGLMASARFAKGLASHCKNEKCKSILARYFADIKDRMEEERDYIK